MLVHLMTIPLCMTVAAISWPNVDARSKFFQREILRIETIKILTDFFDPSCPETSQDLFGWLFTNSPSIKSCGGVMCILK